MNVVGADRHDHPDLAKMGATVLDVGRTTSSPKPTRRNFEGIPNYVEDTGEVNWLGEEAVKGETSTPVIELFKS